jgi:pimeloyl-ACP methyl ester carboxylesterase
MSRGERKAAVAARGVGLAVAALAAVGLGIVLAGGVLAVIAKFARTILMPPPSLERVGIRRYDAEAGTIELSADEESEMPGRYSFWFDGGEGHARVGAIVAETADTVTRVVEGVDFGELALARRGRLSGWYYLGPWELGHPYEDVLVQTDLGPAPAWLIPAEPDAASDGLWAIMVHGWSVRRHECIRAVDTFRAHGFTSLLVSYRNDGEAPDSVDGRYGLGGTEWADVAAAVRFAEANGARRIVLAGWSMGGAIALQTVLRTRSASVVGLVLDSPAIDWHDILDFQGRLNRLPDAVTRGVVETLSSPWGRQISGLHRPIDFRALDVLSQAQALRVPMLILHSADDGFVPDTASGRLAELRPDLVQLDEWSGARHAKLWNYDPARWEGVVGDWLDAQAAATRSIT